LKEKEKMEFNNNKTIVAIVVLGGIAVGVVLSHFATKKKKTF